MSYVHGDTMCDDCDFVGPCVIIGDGCYCSSCAVDAQAEYDDDDTDYDDDEILEPYDDIIEDDEFDYEDDPYGYDDHIHDDFFDDV